jgi:hypothetical protein
MENKKAQELSITTIILIILGLVVLVVLILGFTVGWGNIKSWIAPSNNVNEIAQQCAIACSTGQEYSFCSEKRILKANDLPDKVKEVENTCKFFAEGDYKKYGIKSCPGLCSDESTPPLPA